MQEKNELLSIKVTLSGMFTLVKLVQKENA